MSYKILKIIPYYGKWPDYLNLFLKSLEHNSIIDIVFVTDIEPFEKVPLNVKFVNLSFDDLKSRIRKLFDLQNIDIKPYKLCDFRPAYGVIFADLIKGYDFWGYGDIDLIYGDQSLFITNKLLDEYDLISFKKGHLQGPFTLYRNSEKINNLFKLGAVYKSVFQTSEYVSFDEFGKEVFYTKMKSRGEVVNFPLDNISTIAFSEEIAGNVKVYSNQHVKEIISSRDILVFEKDRVYNYKTQEDYFFYHWVIEKRALFFKYPNWDIVPDKYYISVSGFYSEKLFTMYKLINLYRKLIGISKWYLLRLRNFIPRRMDKKIKIDTYPQPGFVKFN